MKNLTRRQGFLVILILSVFFSFYNLGKGSVRQWDEARKGINAVEMIARGDYVNYYFIDRLDTWTAKPPLAIWAIAISYKIFGFNEFALRFPSALAIVLMLLISYLYVSRYTSPLFATACCITLVTSQGLIGHHVGRTGDVDALFILFMTIGCFSFFEFTLKENSLQLIISGFSFGLAFLTKGWASVFFLPGLVVFWIYQKKNLSVLKNPVFYLSGALFVLFVFTWYLLQVKFSSSGDLPESDYNRWTSMFKYDVIKRFTAETFESGDRYNKLAFFPLMDLNYSPWYIFFYASLGILLYRIFNKKRFVAFNKNPEYQLVVFSFFNTAVLVLILTFSKNIHTWYIAPALLFIGVVSSVSINISMRYQMGIVLIMLLFTFSFGKKFILFSNPNNELKNFIQAHEYELANAPAIYTREQIPQNVLLYLRWQNKNVRTIHESPEIQIPAIHVYNSNFDDTTRNCFTNYKGIVFCKTK